ncbi:MAG: penicillin-binding protein activator [Alphaproteobacteria bacterium]|nr:penicillin-binding protein activator [Alphaproteobacteria bacterium]
MKIVRNTLFIIYLFIILPLAGCAEMGNFGTGANPWGNARDTAKAPVRTEPLQDVQNAFSNLPPVKVAILLPLSGPQADIGQAMLQSAQLAVFDMGYNNFELIPRDTGGTTSGATQAATSALQDGAQIILGPLFANSVRAVKAVAKPRGVNVIAFSTDWTLADSTTFMMGFMPFSQVDRIAKYSTAKGYRHFALVAARDPYGDLVASRFEQKLKDGGGTISQSIRFTPNDPSVINDVEKLKNGTFQAVFMPVGGAQTEMISSALSYNKMMPAQIKRMGTGLWDDPAVASQPNMQGAWFAAPSPNARRGFESKYLATYGTQAPRIATLAYDATALTATLAKNGFEKSGRPDFNSMAIANQNGFAGTDGIFRFSANGLVERSLAILELRNGQIVEIDPAPSNF